MTPPHPLRARLVEGVGVLGLNPTEGQLDQLLAYVDLLARWNKVYNLTAVREPAEMLTHHLLDSLAVIGPLRRQTVGRSTRLLDVGSGGGLPGVVIAICCPEIEVSCVDAVAKKTAFIQQVAGTLGLPGLRSVHARVENLVERFDVVTSRAFATLADFTTWSVGALAEDGVWMAMKGRTPQEEIDALPATVEVFHVEQLTVPGLDAERCLVWMRQGGTGR
ncbi:16S rRNA (guanine(527)-N(7))-methyltransferase RsmG [Ottowia sp.]|uniref:16S rRNA (guanine(527)-N(7))-methyltransferase RsmG n=1 Tax=Ottowia sp. TaxID=1898956 RepID=UPI001D880366|nr:16S rRNA (guanine(527)-N(7))-methyltransferase RsmG [Ottowia sp.]MCB2026221.1 16S rRNA (guanine(527)-N(7))-methyltransferase RsmG [Ottowia sp.]MCP5259572.1 16S rRNA (guanine(527)-N(7))-methyltransferase RsmG [Burkholderiaceae bacterium]HRW72541.1 16S rRNA (guanine(527)-N(7))-methyltransferase RsmG [Ottowia sp.]